MKFNINGKEVEVDDATLTKALEENKESLDIKNDGLVLRTTEEDTTFQDNVKQIGITTGTEIGRKGVLKALEIEVDGAHKNDATTIKAIQDFSNGLVTKALADAKIEPNEQLEARQKDIDQLRINLNESNSKINEWEGKYNGLKNSHIKSSTMSSLIPDNISMPRADVLTLMNAKIKTDVNENGVVFAVGADGEPMKNKADMSLMSMKDVTTGFFNDNPHLLKSAEGGAGGGDSGSGGGKQTLEQFSEEMIKAGNEVNGETWRTEMAARSAAGTLEI